MKIYTEPKVYVLAVTSMHCQQFNKFLKDEELPEHEYHLAVDDGELLPEVAGRICYMSFGKGRKTNREYLAHIIESGHGSVLEHANVTLLFTGISRSLTHELIRHRHLSFSQLSQRYVDESDVGFVQPPDLPLWLETQWKDGCLSALEYYKNLLSGLYASSDVDNMTSTEACKWARQQARSVLPNCTETKIVVTGNIRAWRGFIDQRATPHADTEIRVLAVKILEILTGMYPNLFADYVLHGEGTGRYATTENRKV